MSTNDQTQFVKSLKPARFQVSLAIVNYIDITMRPKSNKKVPALWLLGLASGLSPFGLAIVVPTLSSIARAFDASLYEVQFVLTAYLLGLAIAQPICGFLCDRYGRRPVMLFGFALFTFASLFCAQAISLDQLIFCRFLQAVGVSVGTVSSRAILRDTYDPNRMAEAMSYIAAVMGLAPVLAPLAGGTLDTAGDYTWIFFASALIGLMVLISMFTQLSETRPSQFTRPNISDWATSYGVLLRSRSFVGNTLVFGFVQGGFFSFIAVGAVLFLNEFEIASGTFGMLWAGMAVFYVTGAAIAARLTRSCGSAKVMQIYIPLGALSGITVLLSASFGELTIFKTLLPLAFMMAFAGGSTPGSIAAAVVDHPHRAGMASGLSSALGMVISGLFTVICGRLYVGNYQPIAFIICLSGLGALLAWWFTLNKTVDDLAEAHS